MTEPRTEPDREARLRRTFGPVVLFGLATAGLAAVASSKPWVGSGGDSGGDASLTALDAGTHFPLASAVSLVLLAAWGVLLVTRGRVRRAFAVVAAVAAVGLIASVVAAYVTLPDSAKNSYAELMGARRTRASPAGSGRQRSLRCSRWCLRCLPSGSSRTGRRWAAGTTPPGLAHRAAEPEPTREQDLWAALDEGRDPTDTNSPSRRDHARRLPLH